MVISGKLFFFFIFQILVVLKLLVSLIGHPMACTARIAVVSHTHTHTHTHTHKPSTITLNVHVYRGLMSNGYTDCIGTWTHGKAICYCHCSYRYHMQLLIILCVLDIDWVK